MRRVLVTGASGFVGRPRSLLSSLRPRGARRRPPGRSPIQADTWHEADLLEPGLRAAPRAAAASHLLHLAWTTEHGAFWSDPANLAWSRATLGARSRPSPRPAATRR